MKKIYKSPLIILVILAVSGILAYSFLNTHPHEFSKQQCGSCHLNYEQPLRFRDKISTLCNSCHGNRNILSHTTGLKPSMRVPSDFHLDENGEMTCATCHDVHMDPVDPASGEKNYLLRSNLRGRELCNACHPETFRSSSSQIHSNVLETAHFRFYTSESSKIDDVSMTCIECHEGALASATHFALTTGNPIEGSHPIGIDYMSARSKNTQLRAPRSISPEVKFVDGKIGCISCHDPFSIDKYKLSVTMEESRLCFECHIK